MSQDNQQTSGQPAAGAATGKRRINGWLLFGLALLVIYFINYRQDVETIACNDELLASNPDVIMLGTWWCPYCADARRYFSKHNIHYCEFDIERTEEGKRRYAKLEGRGIPLLIFGGKYRSDGFDERIIERAMAKLAEEKSIDAR